MPSTRRCRLTDTLGSQSRSWEHLANLAEADSEDRVKTSMHQQQQQPPKRDDDRGRIEQQSEDAAAAAEPDDNFQATPLEGGEPEGSRLFFQQRK